MALIEITAIRHSNIIDSDVGDDHTQYAYLDGRTGGQELNGGTEADDTLDLTGSALGGPVRINRLLAGGVR